MSCPPVFGGRVSALRAADEDAPLRARFVCSPSLASLARSLAEDNQPYELSCTCKVKARPIRQFLRLDVFLCGFLALPKAPCAAWAASAVNTMSNCGRQYASWGRLSKKVQLSWGEPPKHAIFPKSHCKFLGKRDSWPDPFVTLFGAATLRRNRVRCRTWPPGSRV